MNYKVIGVIISFSVLILLFVLCFYKTNPNMEKENERVQSITDGNIKNSSQTSESVTHPRRTKYSDTSTNSSPPTLSSAAAVSKKEDNNEISKLNDDEINKLIDEIFGSLIPLDKAQTDSSSYSDTTSMNTDTPKVIKPLEVTINGQVYEIMPGESIEIEETLPGTLNPRPLTDEEKNRVEELTAELDEPGLSVERLMEIVQELQRFAYISSFGGTVRHVITAHEADESQ